MTKPKNPNTPVASGFPKTLGLIGAVCVAYTSAVAYYIHDTFKPVSLEKSLDSWGQVGDYFGGMLNPFFGLITVILVIYSIHVQRTEFQQSTRALDASNTATIRSSFESSLFAWLGNYRDLLQQIKVDDIDGRNAINHLVNTRLTTLSVIKTIYPDNLAELTAILEIKGHETLYAKTDPLSEHDNLLIDSRCNEAVNQYETMYMEHRAQLDAPLRTLYRLYKWIDTNLNISENDKWHYSSLVRAQLSWPELIVLYYNCQTERGRHFSMLVNKYALLDNLDDKGEILIKHLKTRIQSGNFPCNLTTTAFSSEEAKAALGLPADL